MEKIIKDVPYIDIISVISSNKNIQRKRVYFIENLTEEKKRNLKSKFRNLGFPLDQFCFLPFEEIDKHRGHIFMNGKPCLGIPKPYQGTKFYLINLDQDFVFNKIKPDKNSKPKIVLYKTPLYICFWFFAMQKKYKNCCFPFNVGNIDFLSSYDIVEPILFIVDIDSSDFVNYSFQYDKNTKFITDLCFEKQCKRFIIFLFGIRYNFSEDEDNHMNSIIIDKKRKIIIIFDPWGKTKFYKEMQHIYSDIKKLILGKLNTDYEFLDYKNYNKKKSFQILEPKKTDDDYPGYCFFWNLWFIESVLSNQNLELKEIVKRNMSAIADNYTDFVSFIKSYIAYIHDLYFEINKEYEKQLTSEISTDLKEIIHKIFQENYEKYLTEVKHCKI